jgi:hypothetical protein
MVAPLLAALGVLVLVVPGASLAAEPAGEPSAPGAETTAAAPASEAPATTSVEAPPPAAPAAATVAPRPQVQAQRSQGSTPSPPGRAIHAKPNAAPSNG